MGRREEDRQLERRQRLLDRLSGPFVHRLNNALAVLLGLSDLLEQSEPDAARRAQLGAMREQAHEASALLQRFGMLATSRPTADVAIDLGEVVRAAAAAVEPLCHNLRGSLSVRVGGGPRVVLGQPHLIAQRVAGLACDLLPPAPRRASEATAPRLRLSVYGRAGGDARVRVTVHLAGDRPSAVPDVPLVARGEDLWSATLDFEPVELG